MSLLALPCFAVDIRRDRTRAVLAVHGELDTSTSEELRAALESLRSEGWQEVVVDVDDVSFIDSSGLAVLHAAEERARSEGRRLAITDGCVVLERLLALTNLPLRSIAHEV